MNTTTILVIVLGLALLFVFFNSCYSSKESYTLYEGDDLVQSSVDSHARDAGVEYYDEEMGNYELLN